MAPPELPRLSRRHFLLAGGAAAGAALLGACGGGDDDTTSDDGGTDGSTTNGDLVLVPYLQGPLFASGMVSRIPFGVADADGLLRPEDTPAEVEVSIIGPDGSVVGEPLPVASHVKGLLRAYFPLEVTLDDPGIYTARADLGGPSEVEIAFEVKRPEEIVVPKAGDVFPSVVTPTVADARGVDPLCTADPACSYHGSTAAELLAAGRPMALLVATPAFCKTAACGPVHQVFVDTLAGHPEVAGVHVEVYTNPKVDLTGFAPTVSELKLFLEPCLFLVDPDGKVAARYDAIYDEDELGAALGRLTA